MPAFRLMRPARIDLDDIKEFYPGIANESIANRQLARLYYRFELLAQYPLIGQALTTVPSGLRRYNVPRSPFFILYYPRDDGVEIARVVHGVQHVDRAIQ